MEDAFQKLKSQGQNTAEGIIKWLKDASMMEATFENMQKQGKNDVDSLIQWLKESLFSKEEPPEPSVPVLGADIVEGLTKVVGAAKEAEAKARSYFEGADQKNVSLEKFKEAVGKIAEDQKKGVDEVTKMLGDHGTALLGALQAGASAFKDALTKK